MHPEIVSDKKGTCSRCGMNLVLHNEKKVEHEKISGQNSYKPLYIIVVLITVVTIVLAVRSYQQGYFNIQNVMMTFMAGFFLVFSGFKLLDLPGFVSGYATYDLIAKRVHGYGYIYPFIELTLGLCFAMQINTSEINFFTFLLMTVSGLGVLQKLIKHEKFQCACLGTLLKVPLTNVTLIEDFGMAAMALLMLIT